MKNETVSHTPGPWIVFSAAIDRLDIATLDSKTGAPSGRVAAIHRVAWCNEGQENATAKLIAASPDLLNALESMVEAFTAGDSAQHSVRLRASALGDPELISDWSFPDQDNLPVKITDNRPEEGDLFH